MVARLARATAAPSAVAGPRRGRCVDLVRGLTLRPRPPQIVQITMRSSGPIAGRRFQRYLVGISPPWAAELHRYLPSRRAVGDRRASCSAFRDRLAGDQARVRRAPARGQGGGRCSIGSARLGHGRPARSCRCRATDRAGATARPVAVRSKQGTPLRPRSPKIVQITMRSSGPIAGRHFQRYTKLT